MEIIARPGMLIIHPSYGKGTIVKVETTFYTIHFPNRGNMDISKRTEDLELLEQEAISICQDLIRIPSVNFGDGKGNEAAVAAYVVASLAEVGVDSTMYESAPGRCNVMARLQGSNSNRPGLVVHGHIDVVPANADDWSVDPFCGDIKDGFIWGPD